MRPSCLKPYKHWTLRHIGELSASCLLRVSAQKYCDKSRSCSETLSVSSLGMMLKQDCACA